MNRMTGEENIRVGDKIKCLQNEGYWSVGDIRIIMGLTEDEINMGGKTSWASRKKFRWKHYELLKPSNQSTTTIHTMKNTFNEFKGGCMINRKALLYENSRQGKAPIETVTVLYIGTVTDEDGSYIAASVEKENGRVVEVSHDRLKFII